jgi:hypothetical protein
MVVDLFLVYQFLRRLTTPFKEWEAYKVGIIDERGNVLKKRRDLKLKRERDAFGLFDLMILNIKKLLEKIPGGQTRLASYAAALFLIREHRMFSKDNMLNESLNENDVHIIINHFDNQFNSFLKGQTYYTTILENVNRKIEVDEEIPANNAGSGNVAGLGVGPQGEPGFPPRAQFRMQRRKRPTDKIRNIIVEKKDEFYDRAI